MIIGGVRVFRADGNVQSAIDVEPSAFWPSGQFTDLRITGSVLAAGSITCRYGDVNSVVVLGSMFGPLVCTKGAIKFLQVTGDLGAQVQAGVAGSFAGQIDSIIVTGSVFRGPQSEPDIYAPSGTIKSLQVSGNIGTAAAPVRIKWRGSASDGPCNVLKGNSIFAEIEGTDLNSVVHRIEAVGNLSGTVTIGTLRYAPGANASGLYVNNDCFANVHVRGDVTAPITFNNLLDPASTITIGSKLLCPNAVADPANPCTAFTGIGFTFADALRGQVVINALNDGREWKSDVKIGNWTTFAPAT